MQFTSVMIVNELNVGGLIDGVNLTEALDGRIPLKGDCVIEGNVIFTSDFNAGLNVTSI